MNNIQKPNQYSMSGSRVNTADVPIGEARDKWSTPILWREDQVQYTEEEKVFAGVSSSTFKQESKEEDKTEREDINKLKVVSYANYRVNGTDYINTYNKVADDILKRREQRNAQYGDGTKSAIEEYRQNQTETFISEDIVRDEGKIAQQLKQAQPRPRQIQPQQSDYISAEIEQIEGVSDSFFQR